MELFEELVFTVALSLLVSFILAKLLSMASGCDVAGDSSISGPGTDMIEKAVFYERKHDRESVICDFEGERRVRFVEEAVEVNDHEEREFRAANIANEGCELSGISDANKIDDNEEVSNQVEVVDLLVEKDMEESVCKGGVKEDDYGTGEMKDDKVIVGGDECGEKVVDATSERAKFREIEIESENRVEERTEFREIEIELVKDGVSLAKSVEVGVLESEINKGKESDRVHNDGEVDEEEGLFDDWEGIERTELEKGFGAAVVFVGSKSNADRISSLHSDVKMQLYGLHKIAIEGPCHEPSPMALKVSARAKWHAWQLLGNMSAEVAMEQYITLLSRSIPGWMGDDTSGDGKQAFQDVGTSENLPSDLQKQPGAESKRKSEELKPCVQECDVIGIEGPNSINRDKQ